MAAKLQVYLKELQPMRRTLAGREENCEEEGAADGSH